MSYGIQVRDESGDIFFDDSILAIRKTENLILPRGSSGTEIIENFDENSGVIFINPIGSVSRQVLTYSFDNSSKQFTYTVDDNFDIESISVLFISFA